VVSAAAVLLLGALVCWLAVTRRDPLLGLSGALVVGAAAAAVTRSSHWPAARRGETPGPAGAGSSRDTWDALDRGEDPTA
jgi:hypothetical protein